jgi:hypothetical protein
VFVEPLAANFEILEQVHLKPTDSVVILSDGKMGQLAAQVLTLTLTLFCGVSERGNSLRLLLRGARTDHYLLGER